MNAEPLMQAAPAGPPDGPLDIDALSDALHRALAAAEGSCWLVIDRSAAPLSPDDPLGAAAQPCKGFDVPALHAGLDPSLTPRLVEVDPTRAQGSLLLRASLESAVAELAPRALASGGGRRVCLWLRTRADASVLARHIGNQLVQRRTHGRAVLLRWTDPAVLWALWPLLAPPQRRTLLGLIDQCWLLDPAGGLADIAADKAAPVSNRLDLSTAQWTDIEAIGALNTALRDSAAARDARLAIDAVRAVAWAAIGRARAAGFGDTRDLAAYARLAMTAHPQFDAHPRVRERLGAHAQGDYFTALIDDLGEDDWRRIRADLHAQAPSSDASAN